VFRGSRLTCSATLEAADLSKLERYSPIGERYLVTKYEREAKTASGLLLSQTAAENQSKGKREGRKTSYVTWPIHLALNLESSHPVHLVKSCCSSKSPTPTH
jgi:hypothetical protein